MEFIDLKTQYQSIKPSIDRRIQAVLDHGQYIMGPEIAQLEAALAARTGAKHCIGCASGTDALLLAMMALGIGPGDEVVTTAFSFFATAEIIALLGATPVFVDIDPATYNLDPQHLPAVITPRTKAILPVSLYGQCADMDAIAKIAGEIPVIEDAAQSFGATYKGRQSCNLSAIGCASFFPSKPLGCYGDGGATFTNDDGLIELLRSIRIHGQGADKYENVRIGVNSRLDTIQAAILLEKLKVFPDEIEMRERVARRYSQALGQSNSIRVPRVLDGMQSTWAQYTIQVPDRDKLAADLKAKGIPTAIYYPIPMTMQKGYAHFPSVPVPVSTAIGKTVISLPMHPDLDEKTQDLIIAAVLESVGRAAA